MIDITHRISSSKLALDSSRHKSELAGRPIFASSRDLGLNGFGDRPEVEETSKRGPRTADAFSRTRVDQLSTTGMDVAP